MRKVRSRSLATGALCLLALCATSCGEAPPSYRVVSLGEAHNLLDRPEIALLDAVAAQAEQPQPLPGGVLWRIERGELTPPAELPAGAVLIVASDEHTAHRSAAALARRQYHPVYVYIPRSAEDRTSLHAHAPATEELPGGRDS